MPLDQVQVTGGRNRIRTESSKVDDVSRLVFFKQLTGLGGISVGDGMKHVSAAVLMLTHLRSPSDEPANIHVSPGSFPKRDPSGSDSMMCLIACPTRPVPPVTSTTAFDMTRRTDIAAKNGKYAVISVTLHVTSAYGLI